MEGEKNPKQDHRMLVAQRKCKGRKNQHLIPLRPSHKRGCPNYLCKAHITEMNSIMDAKGCHKGVTQDWTQRVKTLSLIIGG